VNKGLRTKYGLADKIWPHALRLFLTALVAALLVIQSPAMPTPQDERRVKKVTRVKRPVFKERDWDGIYFKDLFKDALVGDRPEKAAPDPKVPAAVAEAGPSASATKFRWSTIIGRETLEDEIKRVANQLNSEITTPIKFKSEYAQAHQSFSMLSMLFAIVHEYDDEVRWKKFAPDAQASFQRAAASSRVGTIQAYENCKRKKQDLTEMVRGGNFIGGEEVPETLNWGAVIDRSPIMERLEAANQNLKQMTANEREFTSELAKLVHESQIVAATALILTQENMTDADDDGYRDFAMAMHEAAMEIVQAAKNQDFESATRAANRLNQSCDDCHSEWR
jgi:cytochrome c556